MFNIILFTIIISFLGIKTFLRSPQFGRKPGGKRMERILNSPNFRNGKFQNINPAAVLTKGHSWYSLMYKSMFEKKPRQRPTCILPSEKTDLYTLDPKQDILVWFGHSSYYLQLKGKKFLIDPIFSGKASPLPFGVKAFPGSDIYRVDDIPLIDYLLITHDHYDHLDEKTVKNLTSKVDKVICGLGVGEILELWGYNPANIIEMDWYDYLDLSEAFKIHSVPTHHGSNRAFSPNSTLWMSFLIQTEDMKIYFGGDSGYGTHFSDLAGKFGPIDLAILDNGQHNVAWKSVHMLPPDVIRAAGDLKTKRLFPGHSCKFALAHHAWDEPLRKITELATEAQIPLVTPLIGQPVYLNDSEQIFTQWWTGLE